MKGGPDDIKNLSALNLLNTENRSLDNCIKIGDEIKEIGNLLEENLDEQEKILNRNQDKIFSIISILKFNFR